MISIQFGSIFDKPTTFSLNSIKILTMEGMGSQPPVLIHNSRPNAYSNRLKIVLTGEMSNMV
jgi:hypothetical protein